MADHQILENPYGGRGPLIMAVSWTEASIALTLMLLRTYTNAFVVKSWKWDYFWAMVTFITGMVAQAMITVSCIWGMGNHLFLLWGPQLVKANLWSWMGQIVAIQGIGFGKIAVIAFLLRIQDRTNSYKNKMLVYLLWFIAISNVIININQAVMILLQCAPVHKLWDLMVPGTCDHIKRTNHVAYFQGSWAAMSDVILAIYPVLFFWNLKISKKIKIGLCFLMAGGLIAAAAGVVKTIDLKLIAVEHDITYAIADLVIWAYTELWLVLILGSLPPLRPLFVRVFHKITSTYSHSKRRNTGYYNYTSNSYTPNSQNGGIRPHHSSKHFPHSHSDPTTLVASSAGDDKNAIPMYPQKASLGATTASTSAGAYKASAADKEAWLMDDTDSERKILGPTPVVSNGDGILRTTHVHVKRDGEPSESEETLGVMATEHGRAF